MLCHTQLHNFNVTVRYRAYDAGGGPERDTPPWRGGYPSPFLTPSILGVFWHRGPLIPPKYDSRWCHCFQGVAVDFQKSQSTFLNSNYNSKTTIRLRHRWRHGKMKNKFSSNYCDNAEYQQEQSQCRRKCRHQFTIKYNKKRQKESSNTKRQ